MKKLWRKTLRTVLFSSLIIFYIVMGLTIFKKKPLTSNQFPSVNHSNHSIIKTLVGHSLGYQIADELHTPLKCENQYQKPIVYNRDESRINEINYDEESNIFVLSSFYDNRLSPYVYIRSVALVHNNTSLYCQLWFHEDDNLTVEIRRSTISPIWATNWDSQNKSKLVPSLISCALPPNSVHRLPRSVSFVRKPCQFGKIAYDIQKSFYNMSNNSIEKSGMNFVVCVKPLSFLHDITRHLFEWSKIIFALGAAKIQLYYFSLNKLTLKKLKSLEQEGYVEIRKVKISHKLHSGESFKDKMWFKRKVEVLAYNDCLYRNLGFADFIIPLDIDEIIVPKNKKNWREIFENYFNCKDRSWKESANEFSSFSITNVYFFKEYPPKVLADFKYTLPNFAAEYGSLVNKNSSVFSRKIRSLKHSPNGESTKSFINVFNTLTVFNHFGFHLLRPCTRRVMIPLEIAQLNHYRDFCDPRLIDNCDDFMNSVTFDDSLENFRNKML